MISKGLETVIGIETCEYHYQYIKPMAFAEEYLDSENGDKYEIQFFCFNGTPRHILVRNDLGDAEGGFAISYDMDWNRVQDRKQEDMTIDIERPLELDQMIDIAQKLAAPFPQVRVDLYLVDHRIYFGEMTFTTSGNILWNYRDETVKQWGQELTLPNKLATRWSDNFQSYISKQK